MSSEQTLSFQNSQLGGTDEVVKTAPIRAADHVVMNQPQPLLVRADWCRLKTASTSQAGVG